jgi:hypothetical protein
VIITWWILNSQFAGLNLLMAEIALKIYRIFNELTGSSNFLIAMCYIKVIMWFILVTSVCSRYTFSLTISHEVFQGSLSQTRYMPELNKIRNTFHDVEKNCTFSSPKGNNRYVLVSRSCLAFFFNEKDAIMNLTVQISSLNMPTYTFYLGCYLVLLGDGGRWSVI